MKILFACGGTAGHINPALAVANYIKQLHPDAQIKFAGNPNGMEARLVPAAGYGFCPIEILGLQRKITPRNIAYNIKSAGLLLTSSGKAAKIIKEFAPDVVMGTGGYVSGPVLRMAHKLGVKTITHEQNAFPGLTTKMLTRYVDTVLLAVEKAKEHLPTGRDYIVTGNPVRQEIIFADRQAARAAMNLQDKICILSFGGSLGAAKVNQAVAQLMAHYKDNANIWHLHATGSYGVETMPQLLNTLQVDYKNNPKYDIREYISDMPDCLAAADLVIGRAGAITLSEIEAAGKASVLIPSPNVSENHQYHNAMVLANAGAAVVIEEKDLTGTALASAVEGLLSGPVKLAEIGQNAQNLAVLDACQRIYNQVMELL